MTASNSAHVATASSKKPAATGTAALLESGKYSDLTVRVIERKWKVHKAVLCTQSDFFARLCDSGFRVRGISKRCNDIITDSEQESHTNECDLSEDNEHAVAAMIHFLYHKDYDWTSFIPAGSDEGKATLHVRIFALAQKYFVTPLEELALERAIAALEDWENIDFAYAAYEAFHCTQNTDNGVLLRKTVCLVMSAHAGVLFGNPERFKDFQDILADVPVTVHGMIVNLAKIGEVSQRHEAELEQVQQLQSTSITQLEK